METLRQIERVEKLFKFYGKCPDTKKGRPLNVGTAAQLEKEKPGSVCAKTAKGRGGGTGERTVLYRTKSYGDKLKDRLAAKGAEEVPRKEEPKPVPQKESKAKKTAKKSSVETSEKKTQKPKKGNSNISAASEKQKRFALWTRKNKLDQLDKHAKENPQFEKLATLAKGKIGEISQAGDLLELKKLNPSETILAVLPTESVPAAAKELGINLGKASPILKKNLERRNSAKPATTDKKLVADITKGINKELESQAAEEGEKLPWWKRAVGWTKEKGKKISKKVVEEYLKTESGKNWAEILKKKKSGEKYKGEMAKRIIKDLITIRKNLPI